MADLTGNEVTDNIRIVGADETLAADVQLDGDGVMRLAVDAQVAVTPSQNLFFANALNGGSADLTVNGSSTPVEFTIDAGVQDALITELRFYGRDNGIQFGNFLGLNSALTNGVEVEVKSNDIIFTLPLIKTTDDFLNKFAFGTGRSAGVEQASGEDYFVASFIPAAPFIIKQAGTFVTDDYIKVTVQDNLTQINYFEFIAAGGN